MANLFISLVTMFCFVFGPQEKSTELTPELKDFCTAIMFDNNAKIDSLMAKINKNQTLPDHSSLINFAIEVRAYNCCAKLISNGFPVASEDLEKIRWLQLLETSPEKQQSAAAVSLSIQEKIAPQQNQRMFSPEDIFNLRLQLQLSVGQLHQAIIKNDIATIEKLLSDDNFDPNTRINYSSALEIAIAHSNLEAVKKLLNTGKITLTKEDVSRAIWRLELVEKSQPGVALYGNCYPIKDSKVQAAALDPVDLTVKDINEWKDLVENAKSIKDILTDFKRTIYKHLM